MTKSSFVPGAWEKAGLEYAYSWRFPDLPVFRQEADCIANSQTADDPPDFDYMGLLAPEACGSGAKIAVRCSFEALGAPMLLLSMEDEVDPDGVLRTLEYYEIVIWKNGLNVWRHHTDHRRTSHYLALGATFPLRADEIHTLSAEIHPDRLLMDVDGHKLNLFVPDLRDRFRLGYTACEGICRLYEMTIDPGTPF